MKLLPLVTPELLDLAAGWLAQRENYQWLDFGNARQAVTPALLRIMAQRDSHIIRVYTADDDVTPIGVVALNNVDRAFRTGTLWGLAGDKSFAIRGYASFAASNFLAYVFREHALHSVNTWVVDRNPSRRLIERVGFRYIGRQRQCHFIDGRPFDRLLYDLLADEFRLYERAGGRRAMRREVPLQAGSAATGLAPRGRRAAPAARRTSDNDGAHARGDRAAADGDARR